MRHHLGQRPVGIAVVPARQTHWWHPFGTHFLAAQVHVHGDREPALRLVCGVREVRQRRGVALGALERGRPVGLQRVHRDDPGRNGGGEILREERPERLVLPGLDVARRPVVEQHRAEHVLRGLADGDRVAEFVAGADEEPELGFVVEGLAGAVGRGLGRGGLELAARTDHRRPAGDNGRGTPVIADGDPLVVRHQRVVGAKEFPHVRRVEDRRIKIRVVADARGDQQGDSADRRQAGHAFCAALFPACFLRKRARQRNTQRRPVRPAEGHQRVERGFCTSGRSDCGGSSESEGLCKCGNVEDLVANGHATARLCASGAEDAEGQVLDREVAAGSVGGVDPAAARGVVGFVEGHQLIFR